VNVEQTGDANTLTARTGRGAWGCGAVRVVRAGLATTTWYNTLVSSPITDGPVGFDSSPVQTAKSGISVRTIRILSTLNTTTLVKSTVGVTWIKTDIIRGTVVHTDVRLSVTVRLVRGRTRGGAIGDTTQRVEQTGDASTVKLTVGGEERARGRGGGLVVTSTGCAEPCGGITGGF